MRLYADGVIRGWLEAFPDDQLILLGAPWLTEEFGASPGVTVVEWDNDSAASRIFGQLVKSAAVFRSSKSDILISLSPVVSPLVPRSRRLSSVQDWRHIKNPHEFSRAQHLYRRLWKRSVAGAGAVVTMSSKTQAETVELVPGANSHLVETGRDYVRYWPQQELGIAEGKKIITTFGHHTNKRPELVIDALGRIPADEVAHILLVVLGARGEFRDTLRARAAALDVLDSCDFPGFVEESYYQRLVRDSSLIILASSDEGFGLPVAEANYLRIPALVTTDSGLADIHSQGIVVAEPTPESVSEAIRFALAGRVEPARADTLTTWAQTAAGFREIAIDAARRGRGAATLA